MNNKTLIVDADGRPYVNDLNEIWILSKYENIKYMKLIFIYLI